MSAATTASQRPLRPAQRQRRAVDDRGEIVFLEGVNQTFSAAQPFFRSSARERGNRPGPARSSLPRLTPRATWALVVLGFLAAGFAPDAAAAAGPGKLTVTWLDLPVHGLAVVMETPAGRVFLIDTGGTKAAGKAGEPAFNAGRDAIGPFLQARGHAEIAGIAISHPHGDHYGGAAWLLENWKVRAYLDNGYTGRGQTEGYLKVRTTAQQTAGVYLLNQAAAAQAGVLRDAAQKRGGNYRAVVAGDVLEWDPALTVEVISPPAEFLGTTADPAKISEIDLSSERFPCYHVRENYLTAAEKAAIAQWEKELSEGETEPDETVDDTASEDDNETADSAESDDDEDKPIHDTSISNLGSG